jgi:hypothetical protein
MSRQPRADPDRLCVRHSHIHTFTHSHIHTHSFTITVCSGADPDEPDATGPSYRDDTRG